LFSFFFHSDAISRYRSGFGGAKSFSKVSFDL